MDIQLKEITIRELAKNYQDNAEQGVTAFNGKLDVRPPYQREFVYKEKERDAVIHTVKQGFPLNVMYWANRNDGSYEIIDGQQRTISICEYISNNFSFDMLTFENLQDDEQEQILKYKLMVYICTGTDSEKLKWFETINIAGKPLKKQELRNAVYSGSFISDAKKYFSKRDCVAYQMGKDYLMGECDRQDYLESALDWIAKSDMVKYKGKIESYMSAHQNDPNALELWQYFQSVMTWVQATFPKKRKKIMQGVEWGILYNQFGKKLLDSAQLEEQISKLIQDKEVQSQKGIYTYVLTGEEKYLSLRTFDDDEKHRVYEIQQGICPKCKNYFEYEKMDGDHIIPWSQGGKTVIENCQMLCKPCNRYKSDK